MKLKCFVACAFGKSDVDRTYEIVEELLGSLGIESQRVDRIVHNEKIDKKILDSIEKCDFAIADLTHARQSVYYEAGHVHGLGKEVLFICRKDHFTGTTDDTRIHFDLITHNVLGWTPGSDIRAFKKELRARITQIILPLKKIQEAEEKIAEERKAFDRLSRAEQFASIRKALSDRMKKKYDLRFHHHYQEGVFGGTIRRGKNMQLAFGFVGASFSFLGIRHLWMYGIDGMNKTVIKHFPKFSDFYSADDILFVCSLSRINDKTIQKALVSYSRTEAPEKTYVLQQTDRVEKVVFIDNIKSMSEFKIRLASVMP
jgi:nucleoside 2-deoxyribosyltransferase